METNQLTHTPGPYIIGKPGGPSGPFWSIVSQQGTMVAMQITSEANAKAIVAGLNAIAVHVSDSQLIAANQRHIGQLEDSLAELRGVFSQTLLQHPVESPPLRRPRVRVNSFSIKG